jgi:IMP dehydrogenase
MKENFREVLCFDDVLLEPQYSDIETRAQIDLTTTLALFAGGYLTLPIISAPMDTVTGPEMAIAMNNAGGLGILHRYNSIDDQVLMVKNILDNFPTANFGAAIGITGDYKDRAHALYEGGCRVFCLDVAHGHHFLMKQALNFLRVCFDSSIHLMAGNVATLESFNDLSDWGADSIRVGVGGGSICSTRVQTGHGIPTLQSVIDCSRSDRDATLIADGGIKNSGDMVKALAAGADIVMCGSLLAGTNETPGLVLRSDDGKPPRKVYRGMASREAQKSWRGKVGSVEGVSTTVPIKGSALDVLHDLEWGIRSGLSYSGCSNISEMQSRAKFIVQTSAGLAESGTHITRL